MCNLGLARLQQGRLPEAQGLLRRALQLNPQYDAAKVGLARVQAAIEKIALSPGSAPRSAG
ncbi:tetratricopeptide repeat protein [Sphingobium sp.]|uniref:tetratricopeptide repeat protein n=1 Tax=Sphingobium sp. TaxID=1912891 RepID=UPI0039C9DBA5